MFAGVYSQRRVLVTGHTGFKGSWLSAWLLQLGAKVAGFSVGVPTHPANFQVLGLEERMHHIQGDIKDRKALWEALETFQPEIVFHLAAQSLVHRAFDEPSETFETNTLGTLNLLECLRRLKSVQVAVIITSDKCYSNVEWTWGYRENDTLGGEDPYSASKACAELISHAYFKSYFHSGVLRMATTRAGNVIGGGDWASQRIVPDCIRAWSAGQQVQIRHPQATRPWQHVLEPLSGYLWLGARLWQEDIRITGEPFNFGPQGVVNQSVAELITAMAQYWPGAIWMAHQPDRQRPEATLLKLCCDKALNFLNWYAILSFPETINFTAAWYRTYYEQGSRPMHDLTCRQIEAYSQKAREQELGWTLP